MNEQPLVLGWSTDRTIRYLCSYLDREGLRYRKLFLDPIDDNAPLRPEEFSPAVKIFTRWMLADPHYYNEDVRRLSEQLTSHELRLVCGHPHSNPSNLSKFVHLQRFAEMCQRFSILLPRTIVQCSNEIAAFECYLNEPTIIKGASAKKSICREFGPSHLQSESMTRKVALLQRRIDGPDVRVHAVDGDLFAELIVSSELDYRFSSRKAFKAIELPENVSEFCRACAQDLNAPLAGIDFMIDAAENWFFLEVNTSPAFQGYDRRADNAIVAAIARWMSEEARA